MNLAKVCEDLSLYVWVQLDVLHGYRSELNLLWEFLGASIQAVQNYLHGADDVSMNEFADYH